MRSILAFLICVILASLTSAAHAQNFRRGDANQDGKVNVSDPLAVLLRLFAAGPELTCLDAADADDDGRIGLNDAVTLLNYLFVPIKGTEIPAPGAAGFGPDPTADGLDCESGVLLSPILISEIHYNPPTSPADRQFVELHNQSGHAVDISGYRFSAGISFTAPEGTVVPANGFVVIAKDLLPYARIEAEVLGPFDGELANGGERLTLIDAQGTVIDSLRYDDRAPWPIGPDGYGSSLERIDFSTPADDYHTWRAALGAKPTPGAANSTFGTPTHPLPSSITVEPERPTSSDEVTVTFTLDVSKDDVKQAILRWEVVQTDLVPGDNITMEILSAGDEQTLIRAKLPAQGSQKLVRFNVHLEFADGRSTLLPHEGEQMPFYAYFVYDLEVPHKLPVLWIFATRVSTLRETRLFANGAAILEVGSDRPLVFGRAAVRGSAERKKVKFLKGNEYRDDRTINVIAETPMTFSSAGPPAPFMEHLGFLTYRDLGALAPRAEWFRVIDFSVKSHTQNVVIQQVNERFFAMNGLSADADIYKIDKERPAKQSNRETGMTRQTTLFSDLQNDELRRATLDAEVDLTNVGMFSVVGVLIENWDGFHNNVFLYDDTHSDDKWKVIPWDLDQVFEECCAQFPITWPLTGSPGPDSNFPRSRNPGVIMKAFHLEPDLDALYRDTLRAHIQPGGPFTVETIGAKIDGFQQLLMEDLVLQEAYMGEPRETRRSQILDSYASIRRFMDQRIPFLLSQLDPGS